MLTASMEARDSAQGQRTVSNHSLSYCTCYPEFANYSVVVVVVVVPRLIPSPSLILIPSLALQREGGPYLSVGGVYGNGVIDL